MVDASSRDDEEVVTGFTVLVGGVVEETYFSVKDFHGRGPVKLTRRVLRRVLGKLKV